MNDLELLERTSRARGAAHRAPLQEWSKDHRGHSAIVNHSNAWAVRAGEFCALAEEVRKRGLPLPDCDCPDVAHDDRRKSATATDCPIPGGPK